MLLSIYESNTANDMKALGRSVDEGSFQVCLGLAHKLRGSFSFIGAESFVALCRKIEELAGEGKDAAAINENYLQLEEIREGVLNELRKCIEAMEKDG